MPELPEIETIVRDLRPNLTGRIITGMIIRPKCLAHMLQVPPELFYENTIGQTVTTVLRKGKYILIPLDNNSVIVLHMGMTGKLLLYPGSEETFEERFVSNELLDRHTHFMLELADEDGDRDDVELHFNDVRVFGNIWVVADVVNIEELDVPGLKDLGPDALGITLEEFSSILSSKKSLKMLLLDQKKIAGVGNIYADEALFYSGIHPLKEANSLTADQQAKLWFSIKMVLKQGIRYRGSSISDYTDTSGVTGLFQNHHKVYGKYGKCCADCGSTIDRVKVGGRSTTFCPTCQPA